MDRTNRRHELAEQLQAMAFGLRDFAEGKRRRTATDVSAPMGLIVALQHARQTAAHAELTYDETGATGAVGKVFDLWETELRYLADRDRAKQWGTSYERLYEPTMNVVSQLRTSPSIEEWPELEEAIAPLQQRYAGGESPTRHSVGEAVVALVEAAHNQPVDGWQRWPKQLRERASIIRTVCNGMAEADADIEAAAQLIFDIQLGDAKPGTLEKLQAIGERMRGQADATPVAPGNGIRWQDAKEAAERRVKRNGWPGVNALATLVGCSSSTIRKAVRNSSFLKARKAEHEAGKAPQPREIQANGDILEELIADQKADATREERQYQTAKRVRSKTDWYS